MPLPYERATSGKSAIGEMERVLRGFGAASFGVMEDYAAGVVTVQFEWRERRVSIQASAKGYAAAWLRQNPYGSRRKLSEVEYNRRALLQANISVYSMLRDWLKGQVTAVEVGMMSFEGAFLGNIMLPSGETVLDRVRATKLLQIAAE